MNLCWAGRNILLKGWWALQKRVRLPVYTYCTILTYLSPLVTCDCHEEMSISSVPDMRCDNFDISSLAKIWHQEGPKILTHSSSFNQTPYLMVSFQLVGKTKNKYGGCYCSSSQSIKLLMKYEQTLLAWCTQLWEISGKKMTKIINYLPHSV